MLTLAVYRNRVAGDGLGAEAVRDRPEVVVKVEAGGEVGMGCGFLGLRALDDGGSHVRDGDAKLAVGESHVGRVESLCLVIPGAAHRGEGYVVGFCSVCHRGAAFWNGELGGAVDAGRGRLDEVVVGQVVGLQFPEEVPRRLNIIVLGLVSALAIYLRIRGGGLGGHVNDTIGYVDGE